MNRRPWTEEEKAEVRRGIAAGLSYRAIGIALGRHDSSVRSLCKAGSLHTSKPKPAPKPAPKPKESTFTPMPDFDKEHEQWMKEVQAAQERRQRQYEVTA